MQAYSIDYWMENGAPREKLIMGMPLYGQSYTLASSANTGLGAATTGPGSKGPYTGQGGLLGYNEICEFIKNDGWNVVGPIDEMGPYAYKGNEWVSYDDKATIRKKVIRFFEQMWINGLQGQLSPHLRLLN